MPWKTYFIDNAHLAGAAKIPYKDVHGLLVATVVNSESIISHSRDQAQLPKLIARLHWAVAKTIPNGAKIEGGRSKTHVIKFGIVGPKGRLNSKK